MLSDFRRLVPAVPPPEAMLTVPLLMLRVPLPRKFATVTLALLVLFHTPSSVIGPATMRDRTGVVSFAFDIIHPHDVAAILNEDNVAVRAGHHCTQPLMSALDVAATTRASFYLYNDEDDVDRLVESLHRVVKIFS